MIKRPKWMILVGVLAIILGFWGMVGDLLSVIASVYEAMQPEMEVMSGVADSQAPGAESAPNMTEETQIDEQAPQREPSQHDETMNEPTRPFFETPAWTMAAGLISLFVSGAYFLAGIFLLTKSFGIRFFYKVVAASILWSLVQAILYFQGQLEMLMIVIPAFAPSIVIDLILAGVVFVGTRQQPPEQPLKKDRELLAEASVIVSNPLNVGVPVITGAFAVLCVLVFPIWIMGIPGVRNDFARGWEMGLDVIIWYPISWIVAFGVALFLKKIMGISHQRSLDVVVSICLSLFLGLALLRLGQAFSLIAGS